MINVKSLFMVYGVGTPDEHSMPTPKVVPYVYATLFDVARNNKVYAAVMVGAYNAQDALARAYPYLEAEITKIFDAPEAG